MAKQKGMVVLIHGLAANRLMMKPIEMHLRRNGFATLNWGYPSIFGGIELHARRFSKILRQLDQDPHLSEIHLVTHSMGGIVARTALAETHFGKLSRLVMLGPPNRGSRVACVLGRGLGWLCKPLLQLSDTHDSFVNRLPTTGDIEIGIIAASHDRVVAIDSTHLSTQQDHCVVASGHSSMLFRADVAQHVENFLLGGRFVIDAGAAATESRTSPSQSPLAIRPTARTAVEPARTPPSPTWS